MSRALPARAESARAGRICHVRLLTLYRRPVFDDADAAGVVSAVHGLRWPWRHAGVVAWRLQPDQWQAVLELDGSEPLAAVVGRFKAVTSRAIDARHRINGWLWGRGFRARDLGAGEDVAAEVQRLRGTWGPGNA
ncbi:transposase [Arenimonas composti]|uniref:Transposase IS200-like domain-containing protein n=1 Tax=Arenimonas composti TR7-09 = DSM 18010 TaxID=1121013 RepID=A0A091C2V4_9GAMM|nr:transposase [Arenimonas composti]KFN50935.1 hypothetical protein P873_04850 [Arenimonas composti TR7-09 = DSM 18010]